MNEIVGRLLLILNEIEDKPTKSPSSSDNSFKQGSCESSLFLLCIDCPKDRVADCGHVIEAIGLKNSMGPIQIITDPVGLTPAFQPINDIVKSY